MSRSSKYGIIVKTGAALEKLAAMQTLALDKTGTLTVGQPSVASVRAYGKFTQDEVLSLAASLEQSSNHVLASAITSAAAAKQLKVSKAKHVSESAGHGLTARLRSQDVLVGRLDFLKDNGVGLPKGFKASDQTASYVAIDGQLAGVIHFSDELPPEAKATLAKLRQMGVKRFLMLTGDHQTAAAAVAKQLGIKHFQAEALPGDKLRAIEQVEDRPIGFVGDGVNDAPVLTAADVGIALGARGSTAASESADVVVMQDDFAYVGHSVDIARRSVKIARQSIVIGIAISVGLMLVFATGRFTPVIGAILQEVVDVVVIFNALRAHSIKLETSA
jgi:P-type E1-E2 ATPase